MTKIDPLFHSASFLAQTAAPAQGGGGMPPVMLVAYGLLFVAMYFLMIAPQRKKQKELQKAIESMQAGDEIVTAGGLYGEIVRKKDDRFVIEIAKNVQVEIGKSFVSAVVKKAEAK